MKKFYLITFTGLLFFSSMVASGQRKSRSYKGPTKNPLATSASRLRHTPGIKAFGGSYGITDGGHYYQSESLFYIIQSTAVRVNGVYNPGELGGIRYQRAELAIAYSYSPYNVAGFFFVTGLGGLIGRYELFEGQKEMQINDQFNAGMTLGIETELFFSKMVCLTIRANQDYFIKSPGNWRNVLCVGLRINIK